MDEASLHLHGCSLAPQPPDQLQLWKEEFLLEDAKKLADLKVENDEVLAMCYATAGEWPTHSTPTSFGMPARPMLQLHLD